MNAEPPKNNGPLHAAPGDNLAARVERVESLLQILGQLPDEEPPANLVQRTMERVAEAMSEGMGRPASVPAGIHVQAQQQRPA